MKIIAQHIAQVLVNDALVADLVADKVNWGLAGENVRTPFVLFGIEETKGMSKDRRGFAANIRCFGKNMDEASDVYEAVKAVMQNAGHDFINGQGGISDDEYREAVMELNFNLKNI